MTATHNIIIRQGSNETRTFYLKDPDGVGVVLSDCSVACQIRSKTDSPKVVLNPVLSIVEDDSSIVMSIPKSLTEGMSFSGMKTGHVTEGSDEAHGYLAVYDVELTFADGTTSRVVEGYICFSPEVTRG